MNTEKPSKTKTSFYRRIYLAYLIDSGINNVPAIVEATGMPKRTAQDTLVALKELAIDIEFVGGTKNGFYRVNSWGAVSKSWIEENLGMVKQVLQYP